jgi:cardiolipin synthase C
MNLNRVSIFKLTIILLTSVISISATADRVQLLKTSSDALFARMNAIGAAKKEILFETYDLGRDQIASAIVELLIKKAREGVKIKVILDAYATELPLAAIREMKKEAGENLDVKYYNQAFTLSSAYSIMHRDHAKILVIDENVAIMGGRNTTSEYFGLNPWHNFIDLDVIISGPVAKDIQSNFMALWNSKSVHNPVGDGDLQIMSLVIDYCKPKHSHKQHSDQDWLDCMNKTIPLLKQGYKNFFEITMGSFNLNDPAILDWKESGFEIPDLKFKAHDLASIDSDHRENLALNREYLDEISKAQKLVRLVTPYLLPTKELFEVFKSVLSRGVQIEVITNSATSTDSDLFYAGYRASIQNIINLGIKVYEMKGKETLHAKAALIDNNIAIIGSYNLDPRSAYLNREVAVFIHDNNQVGLANDVGEFMNKLKARSSLTDSVGKSLSRANFFQQLFVNSLLIFNPLFRHEL